MLKPAYERRRSAPRRVAQVGTRGRVLPRGSAGVFRRANGMHLFVAGIVYFALMIAGLVALVIYISG